MPFRRTLMNRWTPANKYGWATRTCESCHGPGSKHADSAIAADILNPPKLKPAEADKICLTCHLNQPTHVGRINSSHARNQVSCTACHSIHANGPNGLVARKQTDINELCAGCHADVWASSSGLTNTACPEGAMSCVDCHNPHGSFLPRSIADREPPTSRAASNATATSAGRSPTSTRPCAWRAAPPATSRTARPIRAC